MSFTTGAALLDAIVLAVVAREEQGTYGYRITQEVKQVLDISESTLYPVLRRLQKDGLLTTYDAPCNGRNRRYYQATGAGCAQLAHGVRPFACDIGRMIEPSTCSPVSEPLSMA